MRNLGLMLPTQLRFVSRYMLERRKILILIYHRVGKSDSWSYPILAEKAFESHIKRLLGKGFRMFMLSDLVTLLREPECIPPRSAIITFDDGYKDNYLSAYPILKKYNVPATIFLVTDYIDRNEAFWWDQVRYLFTHTHVTRLEMAGIGLRHIRTERDRSRVREDVCGYLRGLSKEPRGKFIQDLSSCLRVMPPLNWGDFVMRWEDVQELSQSGLIEIGAHSLSHSVLTNVPLDEATREITQSKSEIEQSIQKSVLSFSYPNGSYNDILSDIVRASGYECAVTCRQALVDPIINRFQLPRIDPKGLALV